MYDNVMYSYTTLKVTRVDPLPWYVRPRVFAFICGLIVILLMILCLASSNWLIAHKFRQGLWEQCVEEDAPLPLPFGLNVKPGCYVARTVAYIQAAAALCVITLLCDIAATVMTGCGLCSKNPVRKYLMYRLAFYVMVCALLCILIALVIYPACFAAEIEESNRQLWEFGWAYGVGWGAAIFLFGAILLLLCDKETEEIYYRERALPHDGAADSKA
ncbi:p53 apoptosis effector related to PMP-22 isoform X1 [Rhipicephalus microplus]|uniref:p53 apoptosis effector related to PMP-22 isoform X1 n=1 Tax=Rhipicephalus microplus TaxID=6941 RepID=UPI003F6B4D83